MKCASAVLACVALLAFASSAQATQRYAAPAGTGTECTQEKPCSLPEAVTAAKAGDEVIVGAGTYPLISPIFTPPATNIQIHGEPGGPMPRLAAAFPGTVISLSGVGDSLSYVEIENDANSGAGFVCIGSRIERVRVRIVGNSGVGGYVFPDCAIRNSLFRVEGGGSSGLRGAAGGSGKTFASARNVTAVASGSGSTGVVAEYNEGSPGSYTFELENSIAQGGAQDLKAAPGAFGAGNIAATHSNFDTSSPEGEAKVIDGGGNQTAPPVYVDAENGDFREAAGSPTIDAGIADQLGPLDLAGNTRILGAAPDIGAYEFVPPPPARTSPTAGQIQSLSLKPTIFRAGSVSGAIASRSKKPAAPLGTTVSYSLSAAASVSFTLQKLTTGRKVGKKCVKQTRQNEGHGKCPIAKPVKGSFSQSGAAGQNTFKFSGRIGGRSLKPGRYELAGNAGGVVKRASFVIVK